MYNKYMKKYNTNMYDASIAHAREAVSKVSNQEKRTKNIIDHAEVSEKEIEKYLVMRTKEIGMPCLKYSNPNMVGYPDRIVVLPSGKVVWVELKSKGRKPSEIQWVRIKELRKMGHAVFIIDSKPEVDKLIGIITI